MKWLPGVLLVAGIVIGIVVLSNADPKSMSGEPEPVTATDSTTSTEFTGTVLAGNASPVLDFTQADYEKALASDRLIVLYFYANWCPICMAEIPEMYTAFETLEGENVIGFRVNFNDNQTDAAERDLAREHGVAYQHTKVFVSDGQQISKSPESWNTERYLEEIEKAL